MQTTCSFSCISSTNLRQNTPDRCLRDHTPSHFHDVITIVIYLQETYVWELYQQRSWDFIPVGDCFRKQYEEELSSAGSHQ